MQQQQQLLADGVRVLEYFITPPSNEVEGEEEEPHKYVLLLHGMTESSHIFKDKRSNNGLYFICLDRPGYGGSSPPPSLEYSYGDFARDVLFLLQELQIRSLHAVLGHSSGGPCALALAHYLERYAYPAPPRVLLVASDVEYSHLLARGIKDPLSGPILDLNSSSSNAEDLGFSTELELSLDLTPYRASMARNPTNAGAKHDYFCERRPWAFDYSALASEVILVFGSLDPFICFEQHASFWKQVFAPSATKYRILLLPGFGHFDLILSPAGWSRLEPEL